LETYSTIFTGHSLGGALAVEAALDVLISDVRAYSKFKLYTFGQPRVGNKKFDGYFTSRVEDAYRVVHFKDMVVHVPPCISKFNLAETDCFSEGSLPYYPFHSINEIFYNEDMDSYQECKFMED